MATTGRAREWHGVEGWGVIDSPDTPGGCWVHFSHLQGLGKLEAGQIVEFEWESPGQDGFSYRASRVWLAGQEKVLEKRGHRHPNVYRSTLSIYFDKPQPLN